MMQQRGSITSDTKTDTTALSAPWTMRFAYTRTFGPVVGSFIAGLGEQRILAQRADDGVIFVPPTGYDARDSNRLETWVQVATTGTITAVAWVETPAAHHPFQHAFGWAQIRLDGVNSDLTHFVHGDRDKLEVGSRVIAQWATRPTGTIRDLDHFAPLPLEDEAADSDSAERGAESEVARVLTNNATYDELSDGRAELPEPVEDTEVPVEIDYQIYAGHAMSDFLRGLQRGELIGASAPGVDVVYVPPVGVCPLTLKATTEAVPLRPTATLITYIIVHIPVRDKSIPLPYACGDILLDGADTPFLGLIQGIDTDDVRCGMRLRAVLRPESERTLDTSTILHFVPIDEPDVDVEALVAERRAKARRAHHVAARAVDDSARENTESQSSLSRGGQHDA